MERMTSAQDTHAQDLLDGLDESQHTAAATVDGPVRIVAGAGAGKTRTITRRIAYACRSGQWDPSGALAVTFSVKAANEMRSRLRGLGVDDVTAATFHSAALQQLRRHWEDICDAPFPHIADDGEPRRIIDVALGRVCAAAGADEQTARAVQEEINWAKVSLIAPGDYPRVAAALHRRPPAGLEVQQFEDVYDCYEQEKTSHGLIDFDDILLIACHVLDEFDDVAADIRRSVRWLTVDEYQDVSPLQHRLMTLWLADNRNVCVVGDPAQTIYSFAGASSYDLLSFPGQFGPLAADVSLNTDYRSTPQIVGYANRILSRSPERGDYLRLVSARIDGEHVRHTVYESDADEARGVAGRIAAMVAKGEDPSDFAILTRINVQQRLFCDALRELGLRYRVRRDTGWSGAAGDDPASRQAVLESLGADGAARAGAVNVSTIHASKGLEFRHVFLVGCSEGLMPYGSPADGDALEEERRLAYVGVTRAEDSLHLSYARAKDPAMPGRPRVPSRFLT
ncbi:MULTISPECIES: ATP-dependent helicase [Bifidobacterium]|uniref:ATP-dependent helicase n=1 Tax=Bifidobacterium TaxID=1678 RepID=UPI001BDD87A1|nr:MULTISPECIES: ATP-dependent helicase [Bifidobacterium]MBT1161144.1 ATP-dependent helicase [Bifidobacterium sp. SO1]MBW3078218.1 ATP-dependent helicase [Bifidobacterium simiiventris]